MTLTAERPAYLPPPPRDRRGIARQRIEAARPRDCLTTTEVVERLAHLGFTYRMLDYWVTRWGPLLGVEERAPGSGSPRWVPMAAMPKLCILATLRAMGMEPEAMMDYSAETRRLLLGRMTKVLRHQARKGR